MHPKCKRCNTELNSENWYASYQKTGNHICKECEKERNRLWTIANPEKVRAKHRRYRYRNGTRPRNENKECTIFLGIHVAERVLSKVFKNVERMPMNNPGYDMICNHGKKIDIKSSCLMKGTRWLFHINRNTIADFFLCLAFDNREDLNPLHTWLIPGKLLNHLKGAGISQRTIHKWDEHRLDISKISKCCDAIRGGAV